MNLKQGVIIVDFDGTLGPNQFIDNKSEVVKYSLLEKMKGWRQMQSFPKAITTLNTLSRFFDVIILTGRDETARKVSEVWLQLHGVPYKELKLIPKAWQTYQEYIEFKMNVIASYNSLPLLVIDDDFDFLISVARQFKRAEVYLIHSNQDWQFCKVLGRLFQKEKER